MAGSWKHMTTATGRLRNNTSFSSMLENGGDCYEAAEECFGMVHYLAAQMASMTRVGGGMFVQKSSGELIEEARLNYEHGLSIGGVQAGGEEESEDDEEGDPPDSGGSPSGPSLHLQSGRSVNREHVGSACRRSGHHAARRHRAR